MAQFDDQLNALLSNPESMAQIMNLAQSLSGGAESPPPPPPTAPPPPPVSDPLAGLGGGLDPKLLLRLMPLIQSLGGSGNSESRQLLYAIRPYLREERQGKVDRAIQLARMICVGKQFLADWGNEGV